MPAGKGAVTASVAPDSAALNQGRGRGWFSVGCVVASWKFLARFYFFAPNFVGFPIFIVMGVVLLLLLLLLSVRSHMYRTAISSDALLFGFAAPPPAIEWSLDSIA